MKRRLFVIIVFIALGILILWACTDPVGATPAGGNLGGCGRGNQRVAQCEVTDSGQGFVSGTCQYGFWFSRVATARTWKIGTAVTVRGCEGLYGELYAPIRISR